MAVVISDRLLESSDRLLDAEPDEHLVSLVQSGHAAAFAAIVRRYESELQSQARRLSFDGRGEDAVQQAFLNAFAALQRGGEIRHLRGWLHQILRHEIARARVPIDAPLDAAVAYGETLEDTVQRRATARATLAELSALPDRQRDALLGTAVLGFPRAHVARTMGLSEGAVRQLVHRARLRLREAATAIIPFPLVKLFGAARSGADAAPDAALSAGTAASGGLVIKVGALLASGVVATGIAVTHTFPSGHHAGAPAPSARHRITHPRTPELAAPAQVASVASSHAVTLTSGQRVGEHGSATGQGGRSHGGSGRLSGSRAGRHSGQGGGRGGQAGGGRDGSSAGRGDGSGGSAGGTSGLGHDGGSSGPGSGASSGSGADGAASGSGRSGSGSTSGAGQSGDSGSRSGSATGSAGSGSDGGGGSSHGGHGSGDSGSDGGSGSGSAVTADATTDSTSASSGSSGSVSATPPTVSGDETSGTGSSGDETSGTGSSGDATSGDGSSGDGSSGGGTKNSSGSRDVSGSLASSSS
jgi:RNA polymerase sigma factor (sigma-70 family)